MPQLLAVILLAAPALAVADEPMKRSPAFVGIQVAKRGENAPIVIQIILDNSPAQKAGLKGGDHILRIDGAKPKDLPTAVAFIRALTPGKKAKFLIERAGKEMTIEVIPIAAGSS